MKKTINFEGPILPGSISSTMAKCGKPNCACKDKEPKLHGPYYRWTGVIDRKRTTVTIDEKTMEECRRRIEKYRRFQEKIDQLLAEALKNAPWK